MGQAFVVPFTEEVGAAALRRGNTILVVFDQPHDLDLRGLQEHAAFGLPAATKGPAATVMQLGVPAPAGVRLSRRGRQWVVEVDQGTPGLVGIVPQPTPEQPARLKLLAAAPGSAVAIADPLTDALLLVGTQREPGQGVGLARQFRDFALLPTLQGVAVLARTEDLSLRALPDGFVVAAGGANAAGLALQPAGGDRAATLEATGLSRTFSIPDLPLDALWSALRERTEAVTKAPPLARATPRMEAAEVMLALGLGQEAEGLLRLAMEEDPRAARSPRLLGLMGMAALVAGRFDRADGLVDPRLEETDEVALWRALLTATREEGSSKAAVALARRLPLLLSYTSPLRSRIAPLAAETMAAAGEVAAAERLATAFEGDPALDLARALILERRGDPQGATRYLRSMADGRDRLRRIRAATRLVELGIARGETTPGAAADALERLLPAWRGDRLELALRTRIADLRRQAGAWTEALAILRETAELFPQQLGEMRGEVAATFAAMEREGVLDQLRPTQLVTLVDSHAHLLPGGALGGALAEKFAERLISLDLPKRAIPVLERLIADAGEPAVRLRYGALLASARLADADARGALAALAETAPPPEASVDPALAEQRGLLYARAEAARGAQAEAVAMLRQIGTAGADELRASMLAARADWPGVQAALVDLARKILPGSDAPLDDRQRDVLLRLATAASLAGDGAMLTRLRAERGPQMGTGPAGDAFRLLVAEPLAQLTSVPALTTEIELLQRFNAGLGRTRVPQPAAPQPAAPQPAAP